MSEIREDSEVVVKESGAKGTVLFLDGDEAIVLFDGGFTGKAALGELRLAGEEG